MPGAVIARYLSWPAEAVRVCTRLVKRWPGWQVGWCPPADDRPGRYYAARARPGALPAIVYAATAAELAEAIRTHKSAAALDTCAATSQITNAPRPAWSRGVFGLRWDGSSARQEPGLLSLELLRGKQPLLYEGRQLCQLIGERRRRSLLLPPQIVQRGYRRLDRAAEPLKLR